MTNMVTPEELDWLMDVQNIILNQVNPAGEEIPTNKVLIQMHELLDITECSFEDNPFLHQIQLYRRQNPGEWVTCELILANLQLPDNAEERLFLRKRVIQNESDLLIMIYKKCIHITERINDAVSREEEEEVATIPNNEHNI